MQILRGPIARSLLMGFLALITVLIVISAVSAWAADSSRDAVDQVTRRSNQALLSARLRSETLTLTELLHQYVMHVSQTNIIRHSIQAQEAKLDRLLNEIQALVDPTNPDEIALVSKAQKSLTAFKNQTAVVLTIQDSEVDFNLQTQAEIDLQFDKFREPLLEALQDLETYETQQAELARAQLDRIIAAAQNIVLLTSIGVIIASTFLMNQIVRRLISPLVLLRRGVERIREGVLDQTISITSQDEMGDLAGALNSMSAELNHSRQQLQEYAHTLETQVNERTFEAEQRALQAHTAAQITQAASGTLDLEELLRLSVNLIQERFNLYYAGLFLLDNAHQFARLRAGTNEAGRLMIEQGHQLPLDHNSMIGRCMLEMKPEVELEINASTRRYHNPELPLTRSEMTLPLITQGEVIGAITVQSVSPKAFKPSDITILQTMAGQLANVIGNARLYQEVQREKTLAEAANRTKSKFLANMSHEIRTPLNSILGFTALLQSEENLTPAQRENILIVHRSSEALLSLINNILDLSKIEAGRMTLNENTFNMLHLLENLEDLFRLRAVDKGLKLTIEKSPDLPKFAFADEGKLRQILINLLGNALKFTDTGGVSVQARLATRAEAADITREPEAKSCWLSFSVQDSGIGISPEDLECLFEPFFQAATSHPTHPGTGLGLTISRQYVHLMGGKMYVRSALGQGSTFSFVIPIHSTVQGESSVASALSAPGLDPAQLEEFEAEGQITGRPTTPVSAYDWDALPAGEVNRLRQAILLGDVDQIWLMIQHIRAIQPALAELLIGYANRFDLRGLMAQLPEQQAAEENKDHDGF